MFQKKISLHGITAGGIILVATLLRLVLIEQGWPLTNSDEGTIGLMALHIAYHGDLPVFFYGQHYMGSWEAFLVAGFFRLLGPSLVAVRLTTLSMFVLYLLGLYLLTRLLFSRPWALITLLLGGIGSAFVMAQEIRAIGGYADSIFFSILLFLCATRLALTYKAEPPAKKWRWLVYLAWGLVAGLGLWTDQLVLPAILTSGLFILLVCWRELLKPLVLACLLLGFIVGAAPLIVYNLHATPGEDSLSVLERLRGAGSYTYTIPAIEHEIQDTIQVSLPMMGGEPFCPETELGFLGPDSPPTPACNLAHGLWSAGYLLSLTIAGGMAVYSLWQGWRKRKGVKTEPALQRLLRQQLGRLLLIFSALLSIAFFTFSLASINGAGIHSRYLICILIATPAVFWPLWQGMQNWRTHAKFKQRSLQIICALLLCCFCALNVVGSAMAFGEVPSAIAMNQDDAALMHELSLLKVTHIYGGYWTCDKIAFESNEQITCVVVEEHLLPDLVASHTRYAPYIAEVTSDPRAAYVFSVDPQQFPGTRIYWPMMNPDAPLSSIPLPFRTNFTRIIIHNYLIYLPK